MNNVEIEEFWMKQVEENCKPNTQTMLIGNKIDLVMVRDLSRFTRTYIICFIVE